MRRAFRHALEGGYRGQFGNYRGRPIPWSGEIFQARDYWAAVEALDNEVPAELQTQANLEMWNLLRQMSRRLIALPGGYAIDISSKVERFAPGIEAFSSGLKDLLTDELKSQLVGRRNDLVEAGFPESLATRIRWPAFIFTHRWISLMKLRNQELPVEQVGKIYFALLEQLSLKWLRNQV